MLIKAETQNIGAFLNVSSTYGDSEISFHLFPKDKIMRKKWQTALRIGKPISHHIDLVCSHHFEALTYFSNSKYKCFNDFSVLI